MTARCAPIKNPAPLFFIECSFGRRGNAFLELDRDQNSRRHAIDLIRSGEAKAFKVLEVNEAEGTVIDVTDEILNEARPEALEMAE